MAIDEPRKALSQGEVIESLREQIAKGRNVVPLLGAGISVEAGIPPLSQLTEYLAKVQLYIGRELFLFREKERSGRTKTSRFKNHPESYIESLGWPDPYQLNAELWRWIDGELGQASSRPGSRRAPCAYPQWMDFIVQQQILEDMRRIDEQAYARIVDDSTRPDCWWGEPVPAPLLMPRGRLRGSWKTLLAHLTRASADQVDTLFQKLVRGRQPGISHRFLAFLTPVLNLRLFLTTNFDNLLEEAFRIEGRELQVYEVAQEAVLPHHSLVRRAVSLVKLHGGAFGLRVGERLDSPLDAESRARLLAYLPDRPLLLAMGLGGWDKRVLDIVELVAKKASDDLGAEGQHEPACFWLHFEKELPAPVASIEEAFRGSHPKSVTLQSARVLNPGGFLLELFSRLTESHPPSMGHYRPAVSVPVALKDLEPTDGARGRRVASTRKTDRPTKTRIWVFHDAHGSLDFGSARALSRFLIEQSATYRAVWVDLEACYSVQDVVALVLKQLRRYDPNPSYVVPPAFPGGSRQNNRAHDEFHRRAILIILDALSRGRYLLAFNGVGSFGRRPTQHHGTMERGAGDQRRRLNRFLIGLVRAALGSSDRELTVDLAGRTRLEIAPRSRLRDSLLAFGIDYERSRTDQRQRDMPRSPMLLKQIQRWVQQLKNDSKGESAVFGLEECRGSRIRGTRSVTEVAESVCADCGVPGSFDALFFVAVFRRRRTLVALRRLLHRFLQPVGEPCRPVSREPATTPLPVDRFLDRLEQKEIVLRVEGGAFWMSRALRDVIYDAGIEKVRTPRICHWARARLGPSHEGSLREVVHELCRRAGAHHWIASYYEELYSASEDVSTLFELLYHSISALRYLTKLDALWPVCASVGGEAWRDQLAEHYVFEKGQRKHDDTLAALLRGTRLQRLRLIMGLLETQREQLLSFLSHDTLFHWIEHVRGHDLERFRLSNLRPVPAAREQLRADPYFELERKIEEEVQLLEARLDELELLALRARHVTQDLEGRCTSLIGAALESARGWSHYRERVREILDQRKGWLQKDGDEKPILVKLFEELGDSAQRTVWGAVLGLYEAGLERDVPRSRDQAQVETSEEVRRLASAIRTDLKDRKRTKAGALRFRAEWQLARLRAEGSLVGISPWWFDSDGLMPHHLERRLKSVESYCEKGLGWLRGGTASVDRAARATLRLLLARRHGLAGDFRMATRNLDIARAELSPQAGLQSEVFTLVLLQQAELLLAEADEALLCAGLEGDRERLSAGGAPPVSRGSTICHTDGWRRGGLLREAARPRLELDGERSPFDRQRDGDAYTLALSRTEYLLDRARELIGTAANTILQARRSANVWSCLFFVRSQLEVEQLLFFLADRRPAPPSAARDRGSSGQGEFIARFVDHLRLGLASVRQGLDVVAPWGALHDRGRHPGEVRVADFLRIWLELMVCGGALSVVTAKRLHDSPPEWATLDHLWGRWHQLNDLPPLSRLVQAIEPGRRRFESYIEKFSTMDPTWATRRLALEVMAQLSHDERGPLVRLLSVFGSARRRPRRA